MTRSQQVANDIAALLRARNPLLWVVTREEARAERYIAEAAMSAKYIPRTWDCARGVATIDGRTNENIGSIDADEILAAINERSASGYERGVWILRDMHKWVQDPIGVKTCRILRNLARDLPGAVRDRAQAIVILSPTSSIPPELACHATVIEWPLPDREEIADIMLGAVESAVAGIIAQRDAASEPWDKDQVLEQVLPWADRDAAIDAAVGLTGEEAAACFAKSLVQTRSIVPTAVSREKKRVITREGVLEWFDPLDGGLDAVGGLDNLKAWLRLRATAYGQKAREYGLPAPKGVILAGIPGCGKSLTAKAVATAWGVPLLRLDLGALKSKFVGDSEQNLRKVFRVVEAIGRCVLWLDEIEKSIQGATSGSADGGVSSDALGAILSWMQERKGEAFVIATANDVEVLPPELFRKGRLDEVWWIDLPTIAERDAILRTALRSYRRDPDVISAGLGFALVSAVTEGFTGSEVAEIVPSAMFSAFSDGQRELTTDDLVLAARTVKPISKTAANKIGKLREWQRERGARAASVDPTETTAAAMGLRVVDL